MLSIGTSQQARSYSPGRDFCGRHSPPLSPISLTLGVPCSYVDVEAMGQMEDVDQPLKPFNIVLHLSLLLDEAANVIMADDQPLSGEQVAEMRKKRTFRKFTFRGVDLDKLLDLSMEVS